MHFKNVKCALAIKNAPALPPPPGMHHPASVVDERSMFTYDIRRRRYSSFSSPGLNDIGNCLPRPSAAHREPFLKSNTIIHTNLAQDNVIQYMEKMLHVPIIIERDRQQLNYWPVTLSITVPLVKQLASSPRVLS